jgi:hypothetical protein
LIHFLDVSKRSITVADYVAMTEMKICRKPYVRHLSCELPGEPVRAAAKIESSALFRAWPRRRV